MRAGKLRTKVTFQEEQQTSDSGGGYALAWGNDQTVMCEFISQSGREQVEAGRLESTVVATLRARAKAVSFLTAGWRAVIDNEPWNVKSVVPFGQRDRRVDIVIEKGTSV